MAKLSIDLEKLNDDQLNALRAIDPSLTSSIQFELSRRNTYDDLNEGFTDLAQAAFDLETLMNQGRNTRAMKAVAATNIVPVIYKLLGKASLEGHSYETPKLNPDLPDLTPVPRKQAEAEAEAEAPKKRRGRKPRQEEHEESSEQEEQHAESQE